MEGDALAEAAEVGEEGADFLVPEGEVGGLGFGGGFGEEEVGDGEIADGAGFAVGLGVEFAGEAEGGFADFVGGAGIAEEGGVDFVFVDDGGVVTGFCRPSGVLFDPGDGEDDEGVAVGKEEAAVAEVGLGVVVEAAFLDAIDLVVAGRDQLAPDDAGISVGVLLELGAKRLEFGEHFRVVGEEGVGVVSGAGPTVGSFGEEPVGASSEVVVGEVWGTAGVGAVGDDVHVSLEEEDLASGVGVGEAEDCFAVEVIVRGEEFAAFHLLGLAVVEGGEIRGDLGGLHEFGEIGEDFGEGGVEGGELGGGGGGGGASEGEAVDVAAAVFAERGGRAGGVELFPLGNVGELGVGGEGEEEEGEERIHGRGRLRIRDTSRCVFWGKEEWWGAGAKT